MDFILEDFEHCALQEQMFYVERECLLELKYCIGEDTPAEEENYKQLNITANEIKRNSRTIRRFIKKRNKPRLGLSPKSNRSTIRHIATITVSKDKSPAPRIIEEEFYF